MKAYYQPKGGKKGRFALRENTYRRTWYLIADYPYFKVIQQALADTEKMQQEDNFHVAEPAFQYDLGPEQCDRYVAAIEAAQEKVPVKYVEYIMSHIIERKKYKEFDQVSERTLKIWVQRFIWQVAHNLGDA